MAVLRKTALTRSVPPAVGLVALWLAWSVGRSANPGPIGLRLDDAWIHFVYGRGLLENGFLAYNTGVPSTGCTAPLWAACLAVVHAVAGGGPIGGVVRGAMLVGALVHLLGTWIAADLTRRITGDPFAGIAGGVLVALATPLALGSLSGMEVSLAGTLLLLAARSVVSHRWERAGVWLALAGLTRPEAAAVGIVLIATSIRLARRDPSGPGLPPARLALKLALAPALAGLAVAAYCLWASGAPLPATFYAKSSASLAGLPGRLSTALWWMLPTVPPFVGFVGWAALAGFVPWRGSAGPVEAHVPGITAVTYLLANLWVLRPDDPLTYYHMRYVLPCVPPLLVSLAVGAAATGRWLPPRVRRWPVGGLVACSIVGFAVTVGWQSRHFHNDVRNINEVQRRIGSWLAGQGLPNDVWIASSDAGAVRYFSRRPTVDVMGLNTPQMLRAEEGFLESHPVGAVILPPALFTAQAPDRTLEIVYRATTDGYTVTSNPAMAVQIVARAASRPGGGRRRVRFTGLREFELDLLVPRSR